MDSTTEVVPRDPKIGSASSADPDGSIFTAAAALGISNTNYYDLPKHLQLNVDGWFKVGMTHLFPERWIETREEGRRRMTPTECGIQALVARSMNRSEVKQNKKAMEVVDKEWQKLRDK